MLSTLETGDGGYSYAILTKCPQHVGSIVTADVPKFLNFLCNRIFLFIVTKNVNKIISNCMMT